MKKFVKVLSLALAVIMIFAMTACGGKDSAGTTNADANSSTSDTQVKSLFNAVAKDKVKVGVLHITSIKETSGYTFAHQSGIVEMQKALGLNDSQIVVRDSVNDSDVAATNTALQELVDAGCHIIFATSFNYMNSVEEFAEKYPDVIFSHCSGYKSNGKNFNNYFGRIYEARYLAGIAAGLKTKSNKIGFVAAMDSSNAEVTGGINAFALGIQSVNPNAKVLVKVTGEWYNPKLEGEAAQALLDAGCDVLAQHCDSDTTQTTAEKAGKWGCGYNSDMTPFAPKAHLCAPIWHWGVYYTEAVQKVIDGKWTAENWYEGMNVKLVDVSPLNDVVAAEGTKAKIDAAKAKITNGELFVFAAPLTKADGTKIESNLTDKDITGGINYYLKGVELL